MTILSHISVGSTQEKMATMMEFYDGLFATMGIQRQMVIGKDGQKALDPRNKDSVNPSDIIAVAYGKYYPEFWIGLPDNKHAEASAGNGVHIAFHCASHALVDRMHATALQHGGTDNGAPGVRLHYSPHYYAAFFIDPCGNKLEAVCFDCGGWKSMCTIL
jgi:catechol 2,3-dioxygenase-like lactoylglutathione lyase family enzyme